MNKNPVSYVEELATKAGVRPEWELRDVTKETKYPQFECHLKLLYNNQQYYGNCIRLFYSLM